MESRASRQEEHEISHAKHIIRLMEQETNFCYFKPLRFQNMGQGGTLLLCHSRAYPNTPSNFSSVIPDYLLIEALKSKELCENN